MTEREDVTGRQAVMGPASACENGTWRANRKPALPGRPRRLGHLRIGRDWERFFQKKVRPLPTPKAQPRPHTANDGGGERSTRRTIGCEVDRAAEGSEI